MADITNAINDFKTAANGEAVRDSFVATINLVNDDNIRLLNIIGNVDLPAVASAAEVATTKAAQAATSASKAATSASSVDSKVASAQTAATQAATSATTATNAENTAVTKAGEASTSSTNATTKASEAATSAANALASANMATTKASQAAISASNAEASAKSIGNAEINTTTKASEANASAIAAAESAANAEAAVGVTTEERNTWNAKQNALGFTPEDSSKKGFSNGYAALGADGKVPLTQLPEIGTGSGNMLKSVYDTTNNGVVDNAEKVNGLTVEKAVPSDAKFTDTVYTHPDFNANVNGLYKVTINAQGHVTAVTAVTAADIVALGIPSEDMTATEVLTALKTVDGHGSGLDSDLLDGKEASEFALLSHGTHVTYGDSTTALTSGGTGVVGSAGTLARSDHTHALPSYPDLATHASAAGLHTTTEKQTEWNKNTTDIVLLQQQSGSLSANDTNVRREVLDIKLKLDEMNVVEYLNKTGIGFFDLFEDTSNVNTTSTTATVASTDVVFTETQLLQMLSQTFDNFTTLELAIYDLLRETFTVTPAISNSPTISMNITPGSRTVGEKFYYGGEIYTITNVVVS